MAHLTHGGRIVPILTGHDHDEPTPISPPLLQDQYDEEAIARRSKALDRESLEMPCLKKRGLFALPTEGDGNCLYYSLSDQLYADFAHADAFRQLLADHIASNKHYFMQFVVAEGGERRRPKRAAASVYATRSAAVAPPSLEDKERRFEEMVAATRKNGEWGSSEHLQAFCQLFKVDVNVYTMDGVQVFRDVNAPSDQPRDVVHVAFHDFKHYSSVRTMDGNHQGLFATSKYPSRYILPPKRVIIPESFTSDSTTSDDLAVDVYPPWDIKSIQEGLGGRYDRETIVDMLQKCRGDIDRAFAALLDEKSDAPTEKKGPALKSSLQDSRSSSPFSTGSKRSAEDSDDSEDPRPMTRRSRPKRRIVSNLTLGVGISFRDDQNELVSLNLRMPEEGQGADSALNNNDDLNNTDPEQSDADKTMTPRRSGRLSRPRAV
ncbi:uncharacterized protein PFLUO_LOCUS4825 [Penicillium psychrofluorescens]|uniref:uncharacterized protein n=1 Tax=Penicillium psychrofluorescens TaxID=3158075 RepID=UPI003CCD8FBA